MVKKTRSKSNYGVQIDYAENRKCVRSKVFLIKTVDNKKLDDSDTVLYIYNVKWILTTVLIQVLQPTEKISDYLIVIFCKIQIPPILYGSRRKDCSQSSVVWVRDRNQVTEPNLITT